MDHHGHSSRPSLRITSESAPPSGSVEGVLAVLPHRLPQQVMDINHPQAVPEAEAAGEADMTPLEELQDPSEKWRRKIQVPASHDDVCAIVITGGIDDLREEDAAAHDDAWNSSHDEFGAVGECEAQRLGPQLHVRAHRPVMISIAGGLLSGRSPRSRSTTSRSYGAGSCRSPLGVVAPVGSVDGPAGLSTMSVHVSMHTHGCGCLYPQPSFA